MTSQIKREFDGHETFRNKLAFFEKKTGVATVPSEVEFNFEWYTSICFLEGFAEITKRKRCRQYEFSYLVKQSSIGAHVTLI